MPDPDDDPLSPHEAKVEAAQILLALAALLRSDDPEMNDEPQRMSKASYFQRISQALLQDEGKTQQDVWAWDEWTGNLAFMLGVHQRKNIARR
jgi:hypothetical protein